MRLLDEDWVANILVRLMFPEPPRPPARCGTWCVNTGVWVVKATVTHDDDDLAWFLRFGFGWFGRERELEIGHIAGKLMWVAVETGTKLEMKLERGMRGPRSKKNECARTSKQQEQEDEMAARGRDTPRRQAVEGGGLCKAELVLSTM